MGSVGLDSSARVDIYVGPIDQPNEPIAIIESKSYSFMDESVKRRQIDQLRSKARALGADMIEQVRLLPKYRYGYVTDERVPFQAWKQGRVKKYFMRGVAVRTHGSDRERIRRAPPEGWLVDRLESPEKLDLSKIPMDIEGSAESD